MFFRMFLPSTDKVKRKIEILQSNGVFILVTNEPQLPDHKVTANHAVGLR